MVSRKIASQMTDIVISGVYDVALQMIFCVRG